MMRTSALENADNSKQHPLAHHSHEHRTLTPAQNITPQEWSLSRSQTEPLLQTPERSHRSRLSVDGSPRHPAPVLGLSTAPISPARPQKKQRSNTSTSITTRKSHSRTSPGLPKLPSLPTFRTKPDLPDSTSAPPVPASDSHPATTAAPLLRTHSSTSTTDSRPLPQKRAPASRSSYGTDTFDGPPPSFTTQRTLSQDRLWKALPGDKTNVLQVASAGYPHERVESPPIKVDEVAKDQESSSSQRELDTTRTPRMTVDVLGDARSADADPPSAGHSTETLCTNGGQLVMRPDMPSADEGSKYSGSDGRKSEDLFLNIAQTENGDQNPMTRSERRQSRIGTFFLSPAVGSSNHPSREVTPPHQGHMDGDSGSHGTEVLYHGNKRHSFGPRSTAASAHPLDDAGRQRYFSSGTRMLRRGTQSIITRTDRETTPELQKITNHKTGKVGSGSRLYHRSNLSATPDRLRHVEISRVEGTDSTMSTTAPSTVWDELDELKWRIKKLELTGKLPSSSAAAMSTVERPQTATTTITTLSSSSRHGRGSTTPIESVIDGVRATVHPLLHEALRKARPVLEPDIYQKLEATASDALQLASVMGSGVQSGNGAANGPLSSAERQLRRRADSMCRGLTELIIALSAGAGPRSPSGVLQPFRPQSCDVSATVGQTPSPMNHRVDSPSHISQRFSTGLDDSLRLLTSQIQPHSGTRRTSVLLNSRVSSPPEYRSSELAVRTPSSTHSQNQMQPNPSSRLTRTTTRLHRARAVDVTDDSDNNDSPSLSQASRARTKIGLRPRSARDRTSQGREYTSSYPLPGKGSDSTVDMSPSLVANSGPSFRRPDASSNANDVNHSFNRAMTPKDNVGPGHPHYVSSGLGRERSTEHTPENVTIQRGSASGSRRSLGLTSRLGQVSLFMNGRLRAAKEEREAREFARDNSIDHLNLRDRPTNE